MSERGDKIEAAARDLLAWALDDTTKIPVGVDYRHVTDHLLQALKAALHAPAEREDEVERVTRVVLVDHTSECLGRLYDKWGVRVEIQRQDDGRTLKVFVTDRHESARRGGKGGA